ncbi:MAG TPA: glycosyltransferase family A protein [Agriterribacter sp.]|nr:glycosyltransferase family A protein [Agriterribacter sp.]
MMNYRFSIIIPTRSRADVLKWSLKTCVMQEYDNLEIIVSDNFSEDDTKEVVASYKDGRIKYYNTGERMSMSHNWEFALSKATGDYVTVLGDDDGFLPGAIVQINKLLNNTHADAICWHQSRYFWPNSPMFPHELRMIMRDRIVTLNALENFRKVVNHQRHYSTTPWLYSGFVKKEVIQKVKEKSNGIFFHSMIPDVYSGLAIATQIKTYIYSTGPFSIAGNSSHSNGLSSISSTEKDRKNFNVFLSENPIPFHPSLELIASALPLLVAESALQVFDLKLITDKEYYPDLRRTLRVCFAEALHKEETMMQREISGLRKIAEKNNIDWKEITGQLTAPTSMRKKVNSLKYNIRFGLMGKVINGDKAGLKNIYDAAILHDKIWRSQSRFVFNMVRKLSEVVNGK